MTDINSETVERQGYKKTKLGWIPAEWEMKSLLSIAAREKFSFSNGPFGSDLLSSELTDKGVPVIYIRDIKPNKFQWKSNVFVTHEKADKLLFCNVKHKDILISKVGAPPCIAALYDFEHIGVITQDVIRIRTSESTSAYFLMALINSFFGKKRVQQIQIVGTRMRVSLTEFKKIKLPFPPLPEQQKIAKILSTWDKGIEKLKALIEAKEARKKGLMQRLLTGKVRLNGFEGKWKELKMSDVFERLTKSSDLEGVPAYTISSTKGFVTQKDKFNRVIAGSSLKKYVFLKENDFSYNKGNSKTYPYGCIFKFENAAGLVPFVYISFKMKKNLDSNFYKYYFEFGSLERQLKRIITSGARGDGLLNVNPKAFFDLKISSPQKKEQIAISSLFLKADREIDLLKRKLAALETQKKGMMQQLLTGKTRVLAKN